MRFLVVLFITKSFLAGILANKAETVDFLNTLFITNRTALKWTDFVQNVVEEWSLSPVCSNLLQSALESAQNQTLSAFNCNNSKCFDDSISNSWPVWMLDSWGRPLPGIHSRGPFFFLGHYDQCASLSTDNRSARYCRAEWDIQWGEQTIPLHYGFCILKQCEYVFYDPNITLDLANRNARISCKDAKRTFKWTSDKIVYTSVVALLVVLIIIGTIYERWSHGNYTIRSVLGMEKIDRAAAKGSNRETEYHGIDDDSMNVTLYETELGSSNVPSVALTYKPVKAVFKNQNGLSSILRSFSVFYNVNRLLRTPRLEIDALHGIRVLSAFWVILGHAHLLPLAFVDNVRQLVDKLQTELVYSALVVNSGLAVDSFFLVSATIFSFVIHRKLRRIPKITIGGHVKRALVMYFHRWVRLVPTYAFVLGFVLTFFNSLGSGPVWNEEKGVFGSQCRRDDWVHHLFFLVNVYPNKCMPWMWYLSVDFQLFLFSPVLIAILHHSKRAGAYIIGILIVSVSVYRAAVVYAYNFPVNIAVQLVQEGSTGSDMEEAQKMFHWLYANPFARSAPYLLAILLGWNIHSKLSKPIYLWILRFSSLILMAWAVFGMEMVPCRLYDVIYSSLYRTSWSMGLAIMVWLSYHNQFFWISDFLNARQWVPMSRLGYGIYLTHELLIIFIVFSRRTAWNVTSLIDVVQLALSVFCFSVGLAFVLAILIELPPLTAERKLLMTTRDGCDEEEENAVEMKIVEKEERSERESRLEPLIASPEQAQRINSTEHWVLNGTMNETAEYLSFDEEDRRHCGQSDSSSFV